MTHPSLQLNGFTFQELFHNNGLNKLDKAFLSLLEDQAPLLYNNLIQYRTNTRSFTPIELSEFLIQCSYYLENFLASLFNIEDAVEASQITTISNNPLSIFKKYYILKHAKKNLLKANELPEFSDLNTWLSEELKQFPIQSQDKELSIALLGNHYLQDTDKFSEQIEKLIAWCVQALVTPEGKSLTQNWSSFHIPERIDYENLIKLKATHDHRLATPVTDHRLRDGFNLTDPIMNAREAQDQVNYCIYCHDHDGDFCSKGFPQKKADPSLGLKKNPLDVTLTGCPLEEKISEMDFVKRDGRTLAALAIVMIDNPMCPATGHRICNDCMKACIYQKQEPVNVPQIETRVLTDVLNLPWGVEIYDLLTRWNPLRQKQWIMRPYNGLKIMIAGMGPAGFTLAHHLLLEGFAVVGFDGLKIEPLPKQLIKEPIYRFDDIKENLDERLMAGFGGVAEYGITVRWDKNFLKLIYLSLLRKPYFQVFGNVRFGGTIRVEDAWDMGFDHFVVAVGAGLPKALPIPGSLAPGMRQANDFLMALQLGNAAKSSSLTNLQIRLPAVIIGGGLTGVDTATEVQAYYIKQVEKTLSRFEKLAEKYGEETILKKLDPASIEILEEFLLHGKAVREERNRAKLAKQHPNFIKLIHQWGGVTIVYRRTLQQSPAYINNHEELQKALQEGVFYLEALEPAAAILNQYGHVETLTCHRRLQTQPNEWETTAEEVRLPARSIFVATGTQPNIAYEFEHKGTFQRLGIQYQHYEDKNNELLVAHGVKHCKDKDFGPFTSYHRHDRRVSLIGDTHPVFHGSVVKAIASAQKTYPKILEVLQDKIFHNNHSEPYEDFAEKMNKLFHSYITDIKRCTHNVIELTIQSTLAAKHFRPGQFYRLQNFETFSPKLDHTTLQMEPLALLAAEAKQDQLKFIIIEKGASSKLCALLRPGDPVALMGPTGVRAKVAKEHETVLIIGNQLSLALIQSYGAALRAKGNRVIYLGNFHNKEEVYNQAEIERVTDLIIWVTQHRDTIITNRSTDYTASGDALDVLLRYAKGKLDHNRKHPEISLTDIDRIYISDNSHILRRFQEMRNQELKEFLIKNPRVFGSVYSTMQCMLKGVCAQCLQWQIDPETGQRKKAIFACSWQDQPLELIDFDNIDERQVQNQLQEQLSAMWVDYLFEHYKVARI